MEFFTDTNTKKAIIFGDYMYKILHDYDDGLIDDMYIYANNDTLHLTVEGNCPTDSKRYHADIEYKNGIPHIVNVKQPGSIEEFNVSEETLVKFGLTGVDDSRCNCELCKPVKQQIFAPDIISRFGEILQLDMNSYTQDDIEPDEDGYDADCSECSDYSDFSDSSEQSDYNY